VRQYINVWHWQINNTILIFFIINTGWFFNQTTLIILKSINVFENIFFHIDFRRNKAKLKKKVILLIILILLQDNIHFNLIFGSKIYFGIFRCIKMEIQTSGLWILSIYSLVWQSGEVRRSLQNVGLLLCSPRYRRT